MLRRTLASRTHRIVAAAIAIFIATGLEAQEPTLPFDSCATLIARSELTQVSVGVEVHDDLQTHQYMPFAATFMQAVAMKLRVLLGGTESRLPDADSLVAWNRLAGEWILTAHKDRAPTLRLPSWYPPGTDTIPKSALAILKTGFDAVVADGEVIPLGDYNGDSLSFRLSLVHPDIRPDGTMDLRSRMGEWAFDLSIPLGTQVEQLGQPVIDYPLSARISPEINSVVLSFTVNRFGRAIVESAQPLGPQNGEIPTAAQRVAYNMLARSVKAGLSAARYKPAMIAGCPVEQVVTQRFDFKIPAPPGDDRH